MGNTQEPGPRCPEDPPPPALILSGPRAQHGGLLRNQGKEGDVSLGEVLNEEHSLLKLKGLAIPSKWPLRTEAADVHAACASSRVKRLRVLEPGSECATRAGLGPGAPEGCTAERERIHMGTVLGQPKPAGDASSGKQQPAGVPARAEAHTAVQRPALDAGICADTNLGARPLTQGGALHLPTF